KEKRLPRDIYVSTCKYPSTVKVCHLVRGKMKRRQKRVLQMAFLFMVALIFLPNVGLWSMYREKSLMKSHESGEQRAGETNTNLLNPLCFPSLSLL
ncbi:polypeptide N-acetylgalactosaminyltransferase-like 6, partial [Triplophysa rosa]